MSRKVGGMWGILLCIGFIIKCEWSGLVECGSPLYKYSKSEMRHLLVDGLKRKK